MLRADLRVWEGQALGGGGQHGQDLDDAGKPRRSLVRTTQRGRATRRGHWVSLGQTVMRSQACCRNRRRAMTMAGTGGTVPKTGWTVPLRAPSVPACAPPEPGEHGSHFPGVLEGAQGV